MPPSLEVPRPVSDLAASRVGDEVHLHWTTPGRTTDGVAIHGNLRAEICQSPEDGGAARGAAPCVPAGVVAVQPGASDATLRLAGDLAAGDPRLLAYRLQLRGATGKTAGPGAPAYVAAGAAPEPVRGLKASDSKAGAVLEWTPAAAGPGESVELERAEPGASASQPVTPAKNRGAGARAQGLGALLGKGAAGAVKVKAPAPVRLSSGEMDRGGVIDASAEAGQAYRYTAQRVRKLNLDGRPLELRSLPSEAVTVALRDVFPPEAPAGLVAAPGPASIDLSWEPGVEPVRTAGPAGPQRIASYRVYRQDAEGGEWRMLSSGPLATPAYRDSLAQPGHRYRYRVTAIDGEGRESAPSPEIVEGLEP